MPSKIKQWRSTLTSTETSLTDKVKTVSDVLKKIGTKIVKKDELTPLLEKKAQPGEMKTLLSKIDIHYQATLIEYLAYLCGRHVVSTRESCKFLYDCPEFSQLASGGGNRDKYDQCVNQIQTVIGLCFAKVMSVSLTEVLLEPV